MTNNDLIALLAEVQENLARHVFGPESPACVMCGGESGFDVGRACPEAHDYDLLQRVKLALEEPVENIPLREENAALRAALRCSRSDDDWRKRFVKSEIERVRLQVELAKAEERCVELRELADKAAHEQGLAQRRMLQAQERASCDNCGEQKAPDKVCGHCAEDL